MDKQEYLDAFHENWQGIRRAAQLGLDPPVSSCPGWNMGALIGHVGGVFTFWNKWVRERPRGHDETALEELLAEREKGLPGYRAWRERRFAAEAAPPGVLNFAQRYQTELETRLRALDPAEPVWTFYPPNQTAGFVQRRIAQETAIHLWDAQAAHGIAAPVATELARDGIDEFLDAITAVLDAGRQEEGSLPQRKGERFSFRQTDGDGEWLVEFAPRETRVNRADDHADVSMRGTASDLLLFMWGRVPADRLEVRGDVSLCTRWAELAGTF